MVTKADMRMCPYCAVLKRSHSSPKTQVARIRFSLHKKQRADRARGRSVLSHSGNMLRVAGHMEESVPPNHCGLRAKSRQRLRLRREDSHLPGLPLGHARAPLDMCASKTFRARALTKAPMCPASTGCQVLVLPAGP